jgi:hypothetical protein
MRGYGHLVGRLLNRAERADLVAEGASHHYAE